MATRNRYPLHAIGLILLFIMDYAASGQYSGVLSNIYKKAAQENRPLILVLDNSKNSNDLDSKSGGSDYSYKSLGYSSKKNYIQAPKPHSALDNYKNKDELQSLPFLTSLLQNLGQQNTQNRYDSSNPDKHDHSQTRTKLRNRNRDWRDRRNKLRLRSRMDRTDQDRRDDRDNRDRRDRFRLGSRPDRNDRDRKEDKDDRNIRIRDIDDRDDRDYHERYYLDSHEEREKDDSDRPFKAKNDRDRTREGRNKRDRAREYRDRRYRIRDDRDRHDHVKDNRDRRDRNRDDRDRRNRDRNNRDNRERDVDDSDPRSRGRKDHSIKTYVEKYYKNERDLYNIGRNNKMDRTLRTSVIKNLLRAANDLNCEAKDECADECSDGPAQKQDACEDKCNKKFECDDEKKSTATEVEECDFADSCLDSTGGNENPSTRGIKLGDGEAEGR